MRALVQRVSRAEVRVNEDSVGRIGKGVLVLLGIGPRDGSKEVKRLANKIVKARLFPDAQGRMNVDLKAALGSMLVVSQFTLFADLRRGNRPGFADAAPSVVAEPLYREFIARVSGESVPVAAGVFGAEMEVALNIVGPVTLWYDTEDL
jgi:D-tyrosyl-tRNA(Tyr) deacylase